jgi:hypothetical protein
LRLRGCRSDERGKHNKNRLGFGHFRISLFAENFAPVLSFSLALPVAEIRLEGKGQGAAAPALPFALQNKASAAFDFGRFAWSFPWSPGG